MSTLKTTLITVLLVTGFSVAAQENGTIKGTVTSSHGKPMPYANVGILHSSKGATTDERGAFRIGNLEPDTYTLQISAVGYENERREVMLPPGETIEISIQLKETSLQLDEVVVTGTMNEVSVRESPVKVQLIDRKFLENDLNSNVIDALQNVNGIQQQNNCGVCGTNSIRINGMEGPYTLVLIDGMPIMSNLASVYGFNGIPTSLVDQIEVVKGPNSTLYGTEAMGGVINIRTKSPEDMPLVSVNTHYTSHQEWNSDVSVAPKISDKVQTAFSGNFFYNDQRYDFNGDNFMDVVLNNRLSLFNKWNFQRPDDRTAQVAMRYYTEERMGGTMDFQPHHRGTDKLYGEWINTERYEVLGTYDIPIAGEVIKADFSYNLHDQESYYGTEAYIARQSTWFTNLTWRREMGDHQLLAGLTGRYEQYEDNTPASSDYNEVIPGIFAQDEWQLSKLVTLLGGLRLDYHDRHGPIVSPRLNLKHQLGQWTAARLNVGTGFRQVHLFTEDHAALTGAREVAIREDLQPEQSYNLALNLNHVYQIDNFGTGSLDFDVFYTHFTNKITPNYNISQDSIIYQNLDGYGISRGIALSLNHDFDFPLNVKLGATAQQAYQVTENAQGQEIRSAIEFAPIFSGNTSISYAWKKPKVKMTYTARVMGPQKLPEFEEPFQKPTQSPWYSIHHVKVNKRLLHALEVYAGVKNLFDWTQPSPLIDPENPFSDRFDTIYVYGPLQPRRFYVGVKWHLDRKGH